MTFIESGILRGIADITADITFDVLDLSKRERIKCSECDKTIGFSSSKTSDIICSDCYNYFDNIEENKNYWQLNEKYWELEDKIWEIKLENTGYWII